MSTLLLDKIKHPHDLSFLSIDQLISLAREIREKIISVLSKNGGHLSSNLGIVELSIALHRVFSSPKDKLIFDTSHQSYAHKLLTGRAEYFHTLRQFQGLSGFSSPKESKHDHFYCGHAGTALSLALGMAKSRDKERAFPFWGLENQLSACSLKNGPWQKKQRHIIPVLGDGSFTNGLIFEALNNLPKDLQRFIVVLNDNGLAISKNVGHIKNILSRFINHPKANKFYFKLQQLLAKIPSLGKTLADQGQKITESIKNLVSPATFFEHFGLSYVGPIDGHDMKKLLETFSSLKELQRPIIVHVLTQKGKGMHLAKKDPTAYHGVRPSYLQNSSCSQNLEKESFPKIFGRHLYSLVKKDRSIIALSPAMLSGSHLNAIAEDFPDNCQDVGIAEGHCLSYAGGLALNGKHKVAAVIYSTFLQRALDNLFHDICLQNAPVVLGIDRAGLSGPDGTTHHGIYDLGFLTAMPNLIVAQPRNGRVLKELLNCAFSYRQPIAIRYPNLTTSLEKEKPLEKRKAGAAEVLSRGKDLLIIALGHTCQTALQVKKLLLQEGIDATVADPVFIKPLDAELFLNLLSTHQMVATIEEHAVSCGLGSVINNFIMKHSLLRHLQVFNFGIYDTFVKHGKNEQLLKELGLDAKSIALKILKQAQNLVGVCS